LLATGHIAQLTALYDLADVTDLGFELGDDVLAQGEVVGRRISSPSCCGG
jgi:hypothetical protein